MVAIPIQRIKRAHAGGVVEINIWRVPDPVPPCAHHYKYRLVFVVAGKRLVGFDNERGKGGHRHAGDRETPCTFVDVETLLADFWRVVTEQGGEG
ncbi:MAG: DUF6516 family protein [Rhodocyclaceae bacterium]|nr:DUF6516 family protein [Rhodocyclaceae bacterium]